MTTKTYRNTITERPLPPGRFEVWTPDGWQHICQASTWKGVAAVRRKVEGACSGYGGFFHPDGGPRYGTARFVPDHGGGWWRVDWNLDGPVPPWFDRALEADYIRRNR